ncbi:Cro/CI family transcriptional regulator [Acidiferrobacter thiooxydans]|jgi:DNA-binding transcriptional regulator YdaS (Cro superfamily)|uniref:Transcriptional regulator n=1 Tax=Acidiferrobacter thiooxydans TaxID=163359 RepID=A0A368HFG3_9GAMM|nr:Cro/CI family transcriptional regulator [Acidiferrobacter thiooxydans]RCN55777.1 transcriptional regulator [Acidiferrobacter thiooxydans]
MTIATTDAHTGTEAVARAVSILGSQGRLAQACGVSQAAVWKWLRGQLPKGEHAVAIEVATGGQVSREAIRPDLFV